MITGLTLVMGLVLADLPAAEKASDKDFVIEGKVVTADGRSPLEGVKLTVSTGFGSLLPTADTKSDKDGRFRLAFPSRGPGGGVAIVHAGKPGWHGWSYAWPAHFILSEKPLADSDIPAKTTNLVAGTSRKVEFRMQPAAALKIKLVDGEGKPLAKTRVWLTGDKLPPGASVLADERTDDDGTVSLTDMPRGRHRLVIVDDETGGRGSLELGSVQLLDAAEYTATATLHQWNNRATKAALEVNRGRDR